MSKKIIVLNAGHGGDDTGAIAIDGTTEFILNANMVAQVNNLLSPYDVEVHRIPLVSLDNTPQQLAEEAGIPTDKAFGFRPMVQVEGPTYSLDVQDAAEALKPDLFLSIHHNAAEPAGSGDGTSVFIDEGPIYLDATDIEKLGRAVAKAQGIRFRGVYQRNFNVLDDKDGVDYPAGLLEVCFIDNRKEFVNYVGKIHLVAKAITDWVVDYLELELKPQYREKASAAVALKGESPVYDKQTQWGLNALMSLDKKGILSYESWESKIIAGEPLPSWALMIALDRATDHMPNPQE